MNTHLRVALLAACIPALLLAQETDTEIHVLCSNGLRAAMEKLLASPALQRDLGAAGLARAKREYRWETCARKSLEFFHRV